jgi:hypothetical protein
VAWLLVLRIRGVPSRRAADAEAPMHATVGAQASLVSFVCAGHRCFRLGACISLPVKKGWLVVESFISYIFKLFALLTFLYLTVCFIFSR